MIAFVPARNFETGVSRKYDSRMSVLATVRPTADRISQSDALHISPSSGGSLPDYAFTRDLALPLVKVPYANVDEANHAPNENLELSRFYNGVKISASVYEALAARGQ